MDFSKLLESLAPALGELGVKKLAGELAEMGSESSEPWKKAILALVSNGVETYGPQGIQMALDAVGDLLRGGSGVPEWADLATGSDILAHLQNAETSRKSAADEFMVKVGHVLGQVLSGLIKGLVA
jgi:hypothetical protein